MVGGLYLVVSAVTTGWVGNPVFSEQGGDGHSHRQSPTNSADSFAVGQQDGVTTIEFHVITTTVLLTCPAQDTLMGGPALVIVYPQFPDNYIGT